MSCKPSVTSSSLYSSSLMELKSRRRLCTTEYRDWEKDVLRDSIQTCSFQGTPGPGQGKGSSQPLGRALPAGPTEPTSRRTPSWQALLRCAQCLQSRGQPPAPSV